MDLQKRNDCTAVLLYQRKCSALVIFKNIIGSFEEIPLLEASPISENLFFAISARIFQGKCVHFRRENARILCKLDENARIFLERPLPARVTFIYSSSDWNHPFKYCKC